MEPDEKMKALAQKNKPGFKTTEFWLTVAAQVCGLVAASGAIDDDSGFAKVIGVVTVALASAGYSVSRGKTKSGA